jgi:Cytochrome P460
MSRISTVRMPKNKSIPAIVIVALVLAVLGGAAISAQDKYTVQVLNGLAFSEFRGYEDWQTVAVSQSGDLIEVILANPVMIEAYRAGVPGNGRNFPDGSKMAKIHWNAKMSAEAPPRRRCLTP